MNKHLRKLLAVLMTLAMLLSAMPIASLAEAAVELAEEAMVVSEPEEPIGAPTEAPTEVPTEAPTEVPTEAPTEEPTEAPTEEPTEVPTEEPTEAPVEEPTQEPSVEETEAPTEDPTEEPSVDPTAEPSEEPSVDETEVPSDETTEAPTEEPTEEPSVEETEVPTEEPTEEPVEEATEEPFVEPTIEPTVEPDAEQDMTTDSANSKAKIIVDNYWINNGINFGACGDWQSIFIDCNENWTAKVASGSGWIDMYVNRNGPGDVFNSVAISVDENRTGRSRSGRIQLSAPNCQTVTINVSQAAKCNHDNSQIYYYGRDGESIWLDDSDFTLISRDKYSCTHFGYLSSVSLSCPCDDYIIRQEKIGHNAVITTGHIYDGGSCMYCGYSVKNDCKHPSYSTKGSYYEYFSDTYHAVNRYDFHQGTRYNYVICNDCNALGEKYDNRIAWHISDYEINSRNWKIELEKHNLVNGVCACGYKGEQSNYYVLTGKTELVVGKSATLAVKNILGKTVKANTLSWSSSNTSVLTVRQGIVSAKGEGTAVVTASDKKGQIGQITISVLPKVQSVQIALDGSALANKTTLYVNLNTQKEMQLSAVVAPANATQGVSWKSSNVRVAKISADGLVQFKGVGTAIITATAKDGSKKAATVTLSVRRPVEQIEITGASGIAKGKRTTLKAVITPSNATTRTVTWTTSDRTVATVDAKGIVTARGVGRAVITAAAKDGSGVYDEHVIQVCPIVSQVEILMNGADAGKSAAFDIAKTPVLKLASRNYPADAAQEVKWTSSNAKVAKIDQNGNVELKNTGSAIITAAAMDGSGRKDTLTITVRRFVQSIEIQGATGVAAGKRVTLKAVVSPSNASLKTVKWASSDPSVATVNAKGLVTAKNVSKNSSVVITASANDGSGVVARHTITVRPVVSKVEILINGQPAGKSASFDIAKTPVLKLGFRNEPADAAQEVKWTSSNARVAKVNQDGSVELKNTGSAIITAAAMDGSGRKATLTLNVRRFVSKIEIEGAKAVAAGKRTTLKAVVTPSNATLRTVAWTTSDKNVATVDAKGIVTAKNVSKNSSAVITATAKDGSGVYATHVIEVRPAVSKVEIRINGQDAAKAEIYLGRSSNTLQLSAVTQPDDAGDDIKWTSSNAKVATVNQNGQVEAKKTGSAIITAAALDGSGKKDTITIAVKQSVEAISVSGKNVLGAGKSTTLKATVTPSTASNKTVTWSSSNTGLATVDAKGVVTANKYLSTAQYVTITATAKDGSGVRGSFEIKVGGYGETTYRALLIGNTYPKEKDTYNMADDDVNGMKKMLARQKSTSYSVTATTNKTASQILSSISTAFAGADGNDVSLFFFSGLGYSNGSIAGTKNTSVSIDQLRQALDSVPGYKIVLLNSGASGAAIGKGDAVSFNDAVISAFSRADKQAKANLATDGYVVMTSSTQYGNGYGVTYYGKQFSLFPNGVATGSGFNMATGKNCTMYADYYGNNNGQTTLYESYYYADYMVDYWASVYDVTQNIQYYGDNNFVLWAHGSGSVTAPDPTTNPNPTTAPTAAPTAAPTTAPTTQNTKYRALLVGNTYPGTSNALDGPDNDIVGMQKMLAQQKGTAYNVVSKLNVNATGIKDAITSTFKGADKDDVSLFYYSGHGTSSGSLCGTKNTYISVDELRKCLDKIPGTKIVILDCCYSGKHIGKGGSAADPDDFNNAAISAFAAKSKANIATGGYIVMTACSQSQTSLSVGSSASNFWYGLATYGVAKGSGWEMKNKKACTAYADSNKNSKITLGESFDYAKATVDDWCSSYNSGRPSSQRVYQSMQYYGDRNFVLWASK